MRACILIVSALIEEKKNSITCQFVLMLDRYEILPLQSVLLLLSDPLEPWRSVVSLGPRNKTILNGNDLLLKCKIITLFIPSIMLTNSRF